MYLAFHPSRGNWFSLRALIYLIYKVPNCKEVFWVLFCRPDKTPYCKIFQPVTLGTCVNEHWLFKRCAWMGTAKCMPGTTAFHSFPSSLSLSLSLSLSPPGKGWSEQDGKAQTRRRRRRRLGRAATKGDHKLFGLKPRSVVARRSVANSAVVPVSHGGRFSQKTMQIREQIKPPILHFLRKSVPVWNGNYWIIPHKRENSKKATKMTMQYLHELQQYARPAWNTAPCNPNVIAWLPVSQLLGWKSKWLLSMQSFTKRRALGCEKFLPGHAWLLLSKTVPPFTG